MKISRPSPFAVSLLAALGLLTSTVPLKGQADALGEWSAVFTMPLVAVHTALMQTGQVLMFDAWEIPGTPSARLWNPTTNTYVGVPNGFAELFCSGHVLAPDGRLITTGGHNGGGVGTTDATAFDPVTRLWTQLPFLNYARWYPAVAQLHDGRVLTMGGSISRPNIAEVPEIFAPGGSNWVALASAQKDTGEYPLIFPVAGSRVFVADNSAAYQSWLLDVGSGAWSPIGSSPAPDGTGVMYRPGKVMMTGGGTNGSDPVTRATGVIDLNASSPAWRNTAPMAYGRSNHNVVILPDGTVLVIGGSTEISLISTSGVLPAELWDPATETWTTMAAMATPRMYHSTALLLPDGRVLSAGGGRLPPAVDHLNGELYSPPYLFRGQRPSIASAPADLTYGSTFTIDTPDSGTVARVTLVRASSVTHTRNYDQRFAELRFVSGAGQLTVEAPAGVAEAPPGYYLLFVLDANGVPSVGRIVRIDAPPTGPTLSITDVNVVEGTGGTKSAVFAVTLSGSPVQPVTVQYSTLDNTAFAGIDYTAAAGTLTFAPGTSTATIAVPITTDAAVEPNETFSVALSNATNATVVDGLGAGTILDDDAPAVPSLYINAVSVTEGTGTGTPVATFTVTLAPASSQDVLVRFQTVPGTATSPADYGHTSGTLTFAGGTSIQTIQVPIEPDALTEPDETFTVELSNATNAVIVQGTGVGTITNDDSVTAAFAILSGADDVNEDGTSFAPSSSPGALGNGSSASASYAGLRFTGVTIPRGATITSARLDVESASTQWIAVAFQYGAHAAGNSPAFSTTSKPSQRTLLAPRVNHASDGQWLANTRYTLDEIAPLIQAVVNQPDWSSGNALSLVLRGTGGAWARKFITSVEGSPSRAPRLIVTYAVVPTPNAPPIITAASASPVSGPAPLTVNFSASATDADGDPLTYTWSFGDETTATGATASRTYASSGQFVATVTVWDGRSQTLSAPIPIQVGTSVPTLTINDVSVSEGNSGTSTATFTVTLSAAPGSSTVTASYATANGTAQSPSDYVATSGTVAFSGTTTSATIEVPIVGDTSVEPTETLVVTLTNPSGATLADGTGVATIVNDDVAPLPTANATVTPGTISSGASADLTWSTTDATSVSISPGIGAVGTTGTLTVSPTATTTYVVTATNATGSASASATVTVDVPPPTATLTAAPATINLGQSTTLSWNTTLATTVSIAPGIGQVGSSGSRTVTPTTTTTYTLTATNSNTSATSSASVTVIIPPTPTAALALSPTSIVAGGSSLLSWNTTNASSITISPGIGAVSAAGSVAVSPAGTTTYVITATNAAASATAQATLVVTAPPPPAPTAAMTVSPTSIAAGTSATLTWSTTNAATVSIDQGIGSVAASGTRTVSPSATTTYTLTATNVSGTATAPTTLTVTPAAAGASLRFNGTSSRARFTTLPAVTTFTVEAWVKRTTDTGRYETYLSNAASGYSKETFGLYIDGGNADCGGSPADQFAWAYTRTTGGWFFQCSGVTASLNVWYHVAVTRDAANTARIFINGVLRGTVTNSPAPATSTGAIGVGDAADAVTEFFPGLLDEVRISNVARYSATFAPPTVKFATDASTLALYHFDEGSGQTLVDASGNNRNGVLGASSATEAADPQRVTDTPVP